MQDTPEEIIQKQREIYFNKSANERFLIGAETIDFGKIIVESSIKQIKPDILPIELKIAVFKRYYEHCFSKSEFEAIINTMIFYFKKYPQKL